MASGLPCDTNILLRLLLLKDSDSQVVERAITQFLRSQTPFFFMLQKASEFWNSATRPTSSRGGLAVDLHVAAQALTQIQAYVELLSETPDVFRLWRDLLLRYAVRGVQVHDAKLAAMVLAHGLEGILTLNSRDFGRFTDLRVFHPEEVISRA